MKIGYFINHFPFLDDGVSAPHGYHCGGAENAAYYLALEMAKRSHDITVFTTSTTSKFLLEEHGSLRIHRYGTDLKIGTSNLSWRQFTVPIDQSFDIIHTHFDLAPGPLAGVKYAKSAHLPLIITYHGDWVDTYGGVIRRLGVTLFNRLSVNRILNSADIIISPSATNIERSPFLKLYRDRTVVIPNGIHVQDITFSKSDVNDSKFLGIYQNEILVSRRLAPLELQTFPSKSMYRDILHLPPEKKIVLFLGNLTLQKGPQILLNAMKIVQRRHPDACLVFSGSGPLKEDLIDATTRNGLNGNVIFTDYIPRDVTSLYYQAADIFVLPSFSEAFPLTLLEAGAAGLPIVATNVGGVPDILHDGVNGLMSKTGDPEDLASKIATLLDNDELRAEMGKKGQMLVKQYSWEKIAEETEKVYLNLIGRGNYNTENVPREYLGVHCR
ncbi:glycosyltransferase family 4 protein [Methanoculleus sp. YWC-01]|uniref:Glycosyltransferase family 4 protein n=1 Tax=Methanoculleus nereidis TaxID=2735141 RepID=A0ABU3Z2J6_9EURY|nr:glycosyltransferase family 4 protein [Methanoculleus sp. YWC-01]MDV4343033.1 glycosyltransferase family 4 protein [Methanoculleus sp. YWC-01]